MFSAKIKLTTLGFAVLSQIGRAESVRRPISWDLTQSSTQLGVRVVQDQFDGKKNLNISPFSLAQALSLLSLGLDNQSYLQVAEVLGMQGRERRDVELALQEQLAQVTAQRDAKVKIEIANGVFATDDLELNSSYQARANQYLNATSETLDFTNPLSAKRINSWVSDKTHGMISEIIKPEVLRNLVAALINATYFNADWDVPFKKLSDEQLTMAFQSGNQEIAQIVPAMNNTTRRQAVVNSNLTAVSLDYDQQAAKMVIVMPKDLEKFISKLDINAIDRVNEQLQKAPYLSTDLTMPKFEIEWENSVVQTLKDLGIKDVFSSNDADFTLMSPDRDLYVSDVYQKTKIRVDEKGTEAAAVTAVLVGRTSIELTRNIQINRPFFYYIQDTATGNILFMGSVVNPNK